ncbi:MAG: hypothetical protein IJP09_00720 [Clostridia bacterium]|nr:hypothetical protein [Clostridia bacterium]
MPDIQKMQENNAFEENQNLPSRAGEVIRLIYNAELKSQERLKDAESDAGKIIEEAKAEAEKIIEESELNANAKIKLVRNLTEERGRELTLALTEKSQDECEALKAEARTHIDKAADAVVKKVLESWQ